MEAHYWIIVPAALGASLLTLIGGFGLGTLLLPVFAVFFPLPMAVGLTAVVHLLNNLFKFTLLQKAADRRMLVRFGVPAMVGAWGGAWSLYFLDELPYLYPGVTHPVGPVRLAMALLMIVFAVVELSPRLNGFSFNGRHLVAGGLVSGFFGGLSGHQGALRSMFLLHGGLAKEAYIATGVAIALLVDLTRIPVYLVSFDHLWLSDQWPLLLTTVLAAFLGAWWGRMLIPKITYRTVQVVVGALMIGIAIGLLTGAI